MVDQKDNYNKLASPLQSMNLWESNARKSEKLLYELKNSYIKFSSIKCVLYEMHSTVLESLLQPLCDGSYRHDS